MGISNLFDLTSRSLAVYQRALNVTSHNIANANNPDFSRQRVVFQTERPDVKADGEWGAGVKIDDVLRVRNRLTDVQVRAYNSKYSDSEKRSTILGQVESLFSEPSDLGLSSMMNQFFNSWSKLAVTPNSDQLRNNVIQSAQKMTAKMKNLYEGLNQVQSDLQLEINEKVGDLNNTLKNIQSLNKKITEANIAGQSANDLQDQRDKLIDDLSKLANINVNMDEHGAANISIGGVFAVDGYNANEFKASYDSSGRVSITNKDETARMALNGGEIYALNDLYSNVIPGYKNNIDTLANQLMTTVNTAHSAGYTLKGAPDNTGINFFSGYGGGELQINPQILIDPGYIAASDADGNSGNGKLALQIASLTDTKVINGKSIGEFYSQIVSSLGTEKQLNDQSVESNKLVLDQLEAQKASNSGVSIDEEMTNLIRFQRSYDASAKIIKIADEMLQTLLNMV